MPIYLLIFKFYYIISAFTI